MNGPLFTYMQILIPIIHEKQIKINLYDCIEVKCLKGSGVD